MWQNPLRLKWPLAGAPKDKRTSGPSPRDDEGDIRESAHESLRIDYLMTSWRRSATPTREETAQLKAVLSGRIPVETFALATPDQVEEIDLALATGGSVSDCLRRHGLALGYPRTDVMMSLAWLASGEGDALARLWLVDALARLPESEGTGPIVAEHLDTAGFGRMSFDDEGLRTLARDVLVGCVPLPARRQVPNHEAAIRAHLDALCALRMGLGWRDRHGSALDVAAAATGRSTPAATDYELDFGAAVEGIPEPPRPSPRPAVDPEAPSLDVAPGFAAVERHQKPYSLLERPLPLVTARAPSTMEADLLASLPWLQGPVSHVARSQRLRARGSSPWFWFSPILLVGDAGIGKTRFARQVAERCGVPLKLFSASGQSGAIEILGHSPVYREAHPSAPVAAMAAHGVANPIILVDEIDKFGTSDYNGDPRHALLPMLEPETSRSFFDEFLRQGIDISQVCFIFTANDASGLPKPLLDRLDVFHVSSPTRAQVEGILDSLIGETAAEFGLSPEEAPPLEPAFRDGLGMLFERGASIRKVRRAIRNALLSGAGHAPH